MTPQEKAAGELALHLYHEKETIMAATGTNIHGYVIALSYTLGWLITHAPEEEQEPLLENLLERMRFAAADKRSTENEQ